MCEWPIWPCTTHRGPCIANSIYPPSLGLEEYTEKITLSWYQLGSSLFPPFPFPEIPTAGQACSSLMAAWPSPPPLSFYLPFSYAAAAARWPAPSSLARGQIPPLQPDPAVALVALDPAAADAVLPTAQLGAAAGGACDGACSADTTQDGAHEADAAVGGALTALGARVQPWEALMPLPPAPSSQRQPSRMLRWALGPWPRTRTAT
jgi:hypothetical protein